MTPTAYTPPTFRGAPPPPPGKDPASGSSNNDSRAEFLYWFVGLLPPVGRTLSPLVVLGMNILMNKKPEAEKPEAVLKHKEFLFNKVVSEFSRQSVKGILGVVTYFGAAELIQSIIGKHNKAKNKPHTDQDDKDANFWKTITGSITATGISMFGASLFVPLENYLLINKDIKDQKLANADGKPTNRQKVQILLDKYLRDKQGHPQIPKAMAVSTAAQSLILFAIAGSVYGLTRAFGGKSAKQKEQPVLKEAESSSHKPQIGKQPPLTPLSSAVSPVLAMSAVPQGFSPPPAAQTNAYYPAYPPLARSVSQQSVMYR